jgi:branched-chain amino acid transport system permease protein
MLQDIIVIGLINGSVYALLAVGFSLIFGVARIINLAHTAFYMVAAYGIFYFAGTLHFHPILSIIISIILVTGIGIVFYIFFIEPIREHETAVLIVTVAIALILQELMLLQFGGHYRSVPSIIYGSAGLFGILVTKQRLLSLGVILLTLAAVGLLLRKTRLGLAIRAAAQDREVANLMGMNVALIAAITMGVSVALAAIAGAIVAPLYVLEPHVWLSPLVLVLAVVILGGLGSVKGSVIGAMILAFVEVTVVFLMPQGSFLKLPIAMVIMLIILLVRPEGLFGVYFEGER